MRVHEDLARIQVDVQGVMRALQGSPFDDVPTGAAGFPVDALIQWGEMETGKRIKDYRISRAKYLRNVWEFYTNRRDIDPGWEIPDDMFE